jgi:hypothetical protein
MKKLLLYVTVIMTVLMCSAAFANLIEGTPGADWQGWSSSDLNQDGNPYWDHASWDGSGQSIGYQIANGPGTIQYWGNNDGSADPNFYFEANALGYTAVIKFEIAGFKDDNTFGWYEQDSQTLHPLYAGGDGNGAIASFNPGEDYGYYLKSAEDNTFYTESKWNTNRYGNPIDDEFQHFAVFLDPSDSSFWIGVEDLVSAERCWSSDRDYNDFGVKVNPVPEPATMLLLGSGLIAFAGIGRKKFLKKKGPDKS